MAWIESHQELKEHPKTKRLARMMGWDMRSTIGALHLFWWWCVDYALDGDLRKWTAEDISEAVGLDVSEGEKFLSAMIHCGGEGHSGFIDEEPYLRVHDWWDYVGLFLQRKYGNKNKEKWQAVQQLYSNRTAIVQNAVQELAQPNLTKPNLTKPTPEPTPTPNLTEPTPTPEPNSGHFDFEFLWKAYPNKDGKQAALDYFNASVKTEKDYADIQCALSYYLQSEKVKKGFIKNGSNWFRDRRDWIPDPEVIVMWPGEGAIAKPQETQCTYVDVDRVNRILEEVRKHGGR